MVDNFNLLINRFPIPGTWEIFASVNSPSIALIPFIALKYEEALKDPLNQYFIPLSESTIAVKSFQKMYNILFQNKKQTDLKSYIKYWKKDYQEDFNIFSQLYLKQNINPLFL